LLGWIAEAQRPTRNLSVIAPDIELIGAVIRCVAVLDAADLRLPPSTLYGGRGHSAGISAPPA
jgi:hypothetical protein